jgi:hypothetical protein
MSGQVLALATDTPEMPSDYHMLIVYRAMIDYGYLEVAPEVLNRAEKKAMQLTRQLENNRMPRWRKRGPLA